MLVAAVADPKVRSVSSEVSHESTDEMKPTEESAALLYEAEDAACRDRHPRDGSEPRLDSETVNIGD